MGHTVVATKNETVKVSSFACIQTPSALNSCVAKIIIIKAVIMALLLAHNDKV